MINVNEEYFDENEKPLDRLCVNGGFTRIFRRIAVVGDSLAPRRRVAERIDRIAVFRGSFGKRGSRKAAKQNRAHENTKCLFH